MEEKEVHTIKIWSEIIKDHIESVKRFLDDSHTICNDYLHSKQKNKKANFNVFTIISDLYYRENFHSDIIRFFLDTKEIHGCGDKYLAMFIVMLNKAGREIGSSQE